MLPLRSTVWVACSEERGKKNKKKKALWKGVLTVKLGFTLFAKVNLQNLDAWASEPYLNQPAVQEQGELNQFGECNGCSHPLSRWELLCPGTFPSPGSACRRPEKPQHCKSFLLGLAAGWGYSGW